MRREKDARILEIQFDADGGCLLVQEDDPGAQSVYLTRRELRWLAWRMPLAWARSLWLRDGGGSDLCGLSGWQRDDVFCACEGCARPVVGYDAESNEHYCAKHEGSW